MVPQSGLVRCFLMVGPRPYVWGSHTGEVLFLSPPIGGRDTQMMSPQGDLDLLAQGVFGEMETRHFIYVTAGRGAETSSI